MILSVYYSQQKFSAFLVIFLYLVWFSLWIREKFASLTLRHRSHVRIKFIERELLKTV